MPTSPEADAVRETILDAAEELFYGQGIRAVGIDAVRTRASVTLARIYSMFGSKDGLVTAYLERRDRRWRSRLADFVDTRSHPRARVLAVYEWLGTWFAEPDFRGCAWINAHGELAGSTNILAATTDHKNEFKSYLMALVHDAGGDDAVGTQLFLLAEGAMVSAGMATTSAPAESAYAAAELLLDVSARNRAGKAS